MVSDNGRPDIIERLIENREVLCLKRSAWGARGLEGAHSLALSFLSPNLRGPNYCRVSVTLAIQLPCSAQRSDMTKLFRGPESSFRTAGVLPCSAAPIYGNI